MRRRTLAFCIAAATFSIQHSAFSIAAAAEAAAAIFLPAAGFSVEEKWWNKGKTGHLWSSEPYMEGPNADCSWRLHFGPRGIGMDYCWDRHMAMPVRPVRDE